MARASRIVVAVLVAAFLSPPALAAPPAKPGAAAPKQKSLGDTLTGQAKADYEAARVLLTDGDYAGARIKFQAAYDASKDPRLLWNVAASEKQLRHYAKAVELLKKYAAETSALVSAKERDEAKDLIKTLEPFTVAVTFEVNEAGADVEVDDTSFGKTPLAAPLVIDIGQHKVRVHKDGFRDYAASASIGGSPQQTIAVKLEKEVHQGTLSIAVPAGATVFVDGQPVPVRPNEAIELKLASGGHTVRVTAPGMRAYQSEVVVRDNEARAVAVTLEKETEAEKPKLRVGVGCIDAVPRSTDDGLAIFIDGSPAPAVASGGKSRPGGSDAETTLEYVEFPVESGPHNVSVRITGCQPMATDVVVAPGTGGDIRGALRSDAGFVNRGPAGNPDWWRIGVSLWAPSSLSEFKSKGGGVTVGPDGRQISDRLQYNPHAIGAMLQPAINLKWATIGVDLGVAGGAAGLYTPGVQNAEAALTWARLGFRAGARIPLNVVAINLGLSTGYDRLKYPAAPSGFTNPPPGRGYLGTWASVDVQVLCDWAVFGGVEANIGVGDFDRGGEGSALSLNFGIALQPNRICRRGRDTDYGLTASPATK